MVSVNPAMDCPVFVWRPKTTGTPRFDADWISTTACAETISDDGQVNGAVAAAIWPDD